MLRDVVGTITVDLTFNRFSPSLSRDLMLRDGSNVPSIRAGAGPSFLQVTEPTDIYIRVASLEGYNGDPYDLTWQIGPVLTQATARNFVIEEDPFEAGPGNDRREDAVAVYESSGRIESVLTDDDWYRFDAGVGRVPRQPMGRTQNGVQAEVYDAAGTLLAAGLQPDLRTTLASEQTFFVRVFKPDGASDRAQTYSLRWSGTDTLPFEGSVAPDVPTGSDVYEQNNRPEDAYVLPGVSGRLSELRGLATATDVDWYRISSPNSETFSVTSSDTNARLNLEVRTLTGEILGGTTRIPQTSR